MCVGRRRLVGCGDVVGAVVGVGVVGAEADAVVAAE